MQAPPARGGREVVGVAEAVRRASSVHRLTRFGACAHVQIKTDERGEGGRKGRGGGRRPTLERAAAGGAGSGGWEGERGRDLAGAEDSPSEEAKNDKEQLARELQAGTMRPVKRDTDAGC